VPAAFGWVATQAAEIGEVHASFRIEPGERYLWNFVTLASHRGLGIYPRLLDAIVRSESEAELFWIAYAPENRASGSGIAKAGFMTVAELSFDENSQPAVRMAEGSGIAGDSVFGLPVVSSDLAPCWKCIRAGRVGMSCKDGACHCDYQRPTVTCAA
jgi:hypothetical protein